MCFDMPEYKFHKVCYTLAFWLASFYERKLLSVWAALKMKK